MTRIKFFLLAIASIAIFSSCKKDDDGATITPPRDRAVQYAADKIDIEDYLKSHYLTVTFDANGNPVPTITAIPDPNPDGKVSIWDQTDYPLLHKTIKNDNRVYTVSNPMVGTLIDDPVEYTLYYLKIREGIGQSPTKADSTLVSYRGINLEGAEFDYRPTPVWFKQESVVSGWRNIMTEFKSGNAGEDPSNPGNVVFTDHGVGVMFIPSGLGYFSSSAGTLAAYSPMVFTFGLHKVQYIDTDGDGVLSKNEDLNGNGDLYDDDTDGDGIPNFLDTDDDGDGTLTRREVSDSFGRLYAFDLIPNCQGTTGGLKRHLDNSCK